MFYDIFKKLCDEKGIAPSRAAEEIGIYRSTVTAWKKGSYKPSAETLKKISEYFSVSIIFLQQSLDDNAKQGSQSLDILDDLDILLETLKYTRDITADGIPLTEKMRNILVYSIEIGADAVRYQCQLIQEKKPKSNN